MLSLKFRNFIIVALSLVLLADIAAYGQSDSLKDNGWKLYSGKKPDSIRNKDAVITPPVGPGTVEFIEDVRLGKLVKRHIAINEKKGTIPGYRIQVFSASGANSKTKAREARSEFMNKYPDIPVYLLFQSPNFKIRAGDFRTRLDAEKCSGLIAEEYPNVFIVEDDIQLPEVE